MTAALIELKQTRMPPAPSEGRFVRSLRQAFATPVNAIVSLLLVVVVLWLLAHAFMWGVWNAAWTGDTAKFCQDPSGACWAYVISRWRVWLLGGYPVALIWRPIAVFAFFVACIGWLLWPNAPHRLLAAILTFVGVPVVGAVLLLGGVFGLELVPTHLWGGFLITFVTAAFTLVTGLPIGLLLALGRRSSLPVIRALCIGFIELIRTIPILVILFLAATMLPLLLPASWNLDLFTRTLVAFMLFNAALAAEVFRGGLQSVPRGQYDAVATVGLGRAAGMILIILPQAISAIVPALVNIMIAIVKETTVLLVVGLYDFLGALHLGVAASEWIGPAHIRSTGHIFVAIIYFLICYSLSRLSRRLEKHR
ncbi:MAG: amino acid ABC transporter permease [Xanthobacteraceae bacterium]